MTTPVPEDAMLIVGAGHCGGRAALELRNAGWTGAIHLVGDEAELPYERPPLSKGLLTGESTAQQCGFLPASEIERLAIQHHVAPATRIDTLARTVTLASQEVLPYRSLLIATGGRVRRLTVPGADLPQVLTLRNLDDAHLLALQLQPGQRLVVVGGGFIGLEVAASAIQLGCSVTLLEMGPRLMGRAVPESVAQRALTLHRKHGVKLLLERSIERIVPTHAGVQLLLTDGTQLDAGAVLVGIGIDAHADLARAAGLAVARGIVVNDQLETSVPGIFAAGDVAEFPSVISGALMRQETWHNAETQAHTAARNMLGQHESFAAHPWFWSDQYDHQVQVAGEPALASSGPNGTVSRRLAGSEEIIFYLDAERRLVGACGWGLTTQLAKEFKLARMLVERNVVLPRPQVLQDLTIRLKDMLQPSSYRSATTEPTSQTIGAGI